MSYEATQCMFISLLIFFLILKDKAIYIQNYVLLANLLITLSLFSFKSQIVKSRDITLPTKVRLVKAMVFPLVVYGCESWTVKKAERRRTDAFELWC